MEAMIKGNFLDVREFVSKKNGKSYNFIGFYSSDGVIVQQGFFEKGTNLLVTGIKRGVTFVPKVYKNTGRKAILKINLDENRHFIGFEEKVES